MESMITRCPSCEVAFKVTESQLDVADGLVRCGACLEVFNGREHLCSDRGTATETPTPVAPQHSQDDFYIDDNFDPDTLDEHISTPSRPSDEITTQDSAGDTISPTPASITSDTLTASAEPEQHPALSTETNLPPEPEPEPEPEPSSVTLLDQLQTVSPPEDEQLQWNANGTDFSAEDVVNRPAQNPVKTRGHWGWYVGSLLALIIFILQGAYFYAAPLSRNLSLHNSLVTFCKLARCVIPPLVDSKAITTYGLVVRSHPEQPGALLVEASLVNSAPFSQPFPPLSLQFEDLQAQPVAQRTFTASQYLAKPDKANGLMAPKKFHGVQMVIVDPGTEAVSFSLSVAK